MLEAGITTYSPLHLWFFIHYALKLKITGIQRRAKGKGEGTLAKGREE
jgi:hypothetical protein